MKRRLLKDLGLFKKGEIRDFTDIELTEEEIDVLNNCGDFEPILDIFLKKDETN